MDVFTALFLVIGALIVWIWRKRHARGLRLAALTVSYLLLWAWCCPYVVYWACGTLEWQYTQPARRPSDIEAIVVLGGYVEPEVDGMLHPFLAKDTLFRCVHAAKLYHAGPPCPVVVCGGRYDPRHPKLTLASAMRDYLVGQGVPAERIRLESTSLNTYLNAKNALPILETAGAHRILLVTEAIHLPRAVACFRHQGLDVRAWGCQFRSGPRKFDWRCFLPCWQAPCLMQQVLHEWGGLVWYWWRGYF